MSDQFDKLRSNKYFCLIVLVFFIVFLIVEYNQGDEMNLGFLGILLMFIPKTIYLFNKDLKSNSMFSLFDKTFDYAGKGVIVLFVLQVIYKLCKLNGYL
tara:strand:- start:240 stop:536 length:297 start_codon:yes stop_codon:yes gene_type:complete